VTKPIQTINRYKADLREFQFLLFEQFKLGDLLGKAPFEAWGDEEVKTSLAECYRFAREVLGPLNVTGDIQGCKLENGGVVTPTGFKDAWKKLYEAGWKSIAVPAELGGAGAPRTIQMLVEEILSGANAAFNMYPGLAYGAAEVIEQFGTPDQQKQFAEHMFAGKWGGTMCLTEPHAGTDVGSAKTTATRNADGSYTIRGTKIFISGGDHDLAENIIHLVLARVDGAPAGTKGLTLFIVPKLEIKPDGSLGERNDVSVGALEHKMGINGSATCVLNFGDNGTCKGWPVGGEEKLNQGMPQMFKLMNAARISVGVQGVAVASSAFLNALEYAKDRKQGSSIKQWKDATAPRVPIIEHPDVRRMLLDMKARVEGLRALAVKLTMHVDHANVIEKTGGDKAAAEYHNGQVDLLVPLIKAYGSDQSFQVCATAIQVYGGAGYLKDWPVEQYCRDSKIFSIYEGTNHIQAMDLVGRKLMQRGGANVQAFGKDVGTFVAANRDHATLKDAIAVLAQAMEALTGTGGKFMQWFGGGRMEMVPSVANRFLEMMAETTVGWLLLEAAVIAEAAAAKLPTDHPDRSFYEGKRFAAQYFAFNVLPGVVAKAQLIAREDRTALDMPIAAFAPA